MSAPAVRVVAVAAEILVGLAVAAQLLQVAVVLLPELRPEVAEGRAPPAHKLRPRVPVQVVAVRPVALPQEAVVAAAALLLVHGLVASEILRSR
jgi:hypothetical protein